MFVCVVYTMQLNSLVEYYFFNKERTERQRMVENRFSEMNTTSLGSMYTTMTTEYYPTIGGWGGCTCDHCMEDERYWQNGVSENEWESESDEEEEEEEVVIPKKSRVIPPVILLSKEEQIVKAAMFNEESKRKQKKYVEDMRQAEEDRLNKIKQAKMDAILASLPRFSTKMKEKMEIERKKLDAIKKKQEKQKRLTRKKSTTYKKRVFVAPHITVKGFCTTHQDVQLKFPEVWKDGKFVKAARIISCSKCKHDMCTQKKIRQELNKQKRDVENKKYQDNITRINAAIKQSEKLAAEQSVDEKDDLYALETPEEKDVRIKREIRMKEFVEFKKREQDMFVSKITEKIQDNSLVDVSNAQIIEEPVIKSEEENNWVKVETKAKEKSVQKVVNNLFVYASNKSYKTQTTSDNVADCFTKQKHVENKPHVMCRFVMSGKKCTHQKCNFAHTYAELHPRKCGNKVCRLVHTVNNMYINKGTKVCGYIHEGEDKRNLGTRLKLKDVPKAIVETAFISSKQVTAITPMSDRVLKPYSATQAWGPVR